MIHFRTGLITFWRLDLPENIGSIWRGFDLEITIFTAFSYFHYLTWLVIKCKYCTRKWIFLFICLFKGNIRFLWNSMISASAWRTDPAVIENKFLWLLYIIQDPDLHFFFLLKSCRCFQFSDNIVSWFQSIKSLSLLLLWYPPADHFHGIFSHQFQLCSWKQCF